MNDYNYSYSYPTTTSSTLSTVDVLIIYLIEFLVFIVLYVITALLTAQIFKKAGVPQWIAWVPFYNNWKLLELGGQPGFWAVLAIIPVVSIVTAIFTYISMYYIGKNLGKSGAFVLWGILFPPVWYIWLAFDKSKWGDRLTTV